MATWLNSSLKRDIFKQLYYENSATCNELSLHLDKSVPLVGNAIAELVNAEVLTTAKETKSTGGRKAVQYRIKSKNTFVLSVAMDQLCTTVSVVDVSDNSCVVQRKYLIALLHNEEALEYMISCFKEVFQEAQIPKEKYLGIGLGMPGFVNTKTGSNHSYASTHNNLDLRDFLSAEFGLPVVLDNDSSTIALGEFKFGLAKGKKDVMVVNISWGVGLGMIVDGKIFRGNTGYAGEFSHIPISENDILCECGKKGCLETEATLRTITKTATAAIENGTFLNIQVKNNSTEALANAIMQAANRGDQYCIELIADMAYKIGKAIAILIHIVNPEQVLLSGRASELGKLLIAPIQQALNKYCIPRLMDVVELNVSRLKYNAYTIGAAALVIENL